MTIDLSMDFNSKIDVRIFWLAVEPNIELVGSRAEIGKLFVIKNVDVDVEGFITYKNAAENGKVLEGVTFF